ncbi:MAG: hypothetical protein AB1757_05400 [Acidobacteriota bacterium]
MEAKRLEFIIHEAGCMIMIAPMSLGGHAYEDLLDLFDDQQKLRELILAGAMMPMDLYQDDGYLVRVVIGDLNEQESAEWTARARWHLKVPCGKLLITGALDNDDEFEPIKDGDKFWLGGYVEIEPGEYLVEVLSYAPGDLSTGWGQIENHDGKGLFRPTAGIKPEKPLDYFKRTRPNEEAPAWIRDEGFIGEAEYVNFVVRLAPPVDLPAPQFEAGGFLQWEFRKPEICPVGIRSATFEKAE